MATMDEREWRAFLSEGTRTAKLATTRADGRPHVAPIWFLLEGDDVIFNTGRDTVKGRTILRDPRVALCVDDERPPFAFVLVEGVATIADDPREMLDYATRIGARYMGEDRGEEFGRRNAVEGELLVRVRIVRVVAQQDIAD
ncbi:MAG: putative oxidoreductase [Actinomycetia bacterium]|nr:putative oxidoreductase [Actinomycetes bacterium]